MSKCSILLKKYDGWNSVYGHLDSLKPSVFDFGILIDTFLIRYSTLKTERTINNTNSQIPAIETLYYGFNWLYNKQTSICYCKYTLML